MSRHFAGHHQVRIEAHFGVGVIGMGCQPEFGGADDALSAACRHRFSGFVISAARLDLDENQRKAAAGDNVDLTERCFPAPRDNAIGFGD
jgi:hypothetical protein